ncbi:Hypothetical protein SAMN02745857_01021 [Andreprevotia lacus DSM 23236]|jgi:hypothetical protein|uniref:DUF2271 domain-containing protein n=1 Tax=Andreprevotia lacus DSM 23236 TaxID=1121001 RepID=A0A1W1X9U4_9NEIS|nr:DUF2271 domain-containing protein [Andreprevotia lacus]SMC20590.1 Hypothetical protein SAMN02745857_01021 [Andreprevotia lacus DSM 23236]
MRKSIALLPGLIGTAFGGHAIAADMNVKLEIPRLTVAEYHRPYVAAWIERADQSIATNLALWYDVNKKGAEPGTKWLQDLRQWWRKGGRDLQVPLDGVSGATRPVGEHALSIGDKLAKLPAGEYAVAVEAAREGGGREVVRVPFSWPPKKADTAKAQGQHELGTVSVELKP